MADHHVLLVEDDSDWLGLYQDFLAAENYQLDTADNVEQAFLLLNKTSYDVVVTDLKMIGFGNEFGGFNVIQRVKEVDRTTQVVVITAFGTRDIALEATKKGAFDVVSKPPEPEYFRIIIRKALEARKQLASQRPAASPMPQSAVSPVLANQGHPKSSGLFGIAGSCQAIQSTLREISYAVQTDWPVLIYGETGTGKTRVARAIHGNSARKGKLSVISFRDFLINQEAITKNLRHFQGATFILEELIALQPGEQATLMQMLESMQSENIRMISTMTTTETSLNALQKNLFDLKLFKQFAQLTIYLPPLRERKDGDDIPALAENFIHETALKGSSKAGITLSSGAVGKLMAHQYRKGNVRELAEVIKKAVDFIGGAGQILPEHILLDKEAASGVTDKDAKATGKVFALLIGIDKYQHLRNLAKAVQDARDLHRMLGASEIFSLELLSDEAATKEAILAHLSELALQVSPFDKVIIFFSGHGAQLASETSQAEYLCPVDSDLDDPMGTLISSIELTDYLRKISAAQLLMIMDACHAGGVGEPKDTAQQFRSGLTEKTYDLLSNGQGRVIIASSKPNEVSWELDGFQNGLFTHYLLQGLQGEAARPDGTVWLTNLFGYLAEKVPTHKAQHPYLKSQTEDFVVLKVTNYQEQMIAAQPAQPRMEGATYNLSGIRELLGKVFDDERLTIFCHDHFYEVYDNFSTTMSKAVKIERLLDHCQRTLKIEQLLKKMQAENPQQFALYANRIRP